VHSSGLATAVQSTAAAKTSFILATAAAVVMVPAVTCFCCHVGSLSLGRIACRVGSCCLLLAAH
jgi:hypothetical protein